jgi:hypothetical protein
MVVPMKTPTLPVIADTLVTPEDPSQARTGAAPYPERVRELAFEVWWLDAARNAELTARRLPGYLPEGYPPEQVPDARTIRRWAAKHDWAGEATARMRAVAPRVMDDWTAQLHALVPAAFQTWGAIITADPDVMRLPGPHVNAMLHASVRAIELAGVGLRNARQVGPEYTPAGQDVDVAAMGEAELTRYTRSLITGEDPG